MIDHYLWSGGSEAMLSLGPDHGPVVIAALPLFEEANRTRAFVVAILRRLAQLGIATVLPDVPGQGESMVPLETVGLRDMQDAYAAAVTAMTAKGRRCYALGVRSGALLDVHAPLNGRWHLAPQNGVELTRELARIHGSDLAPDQPIEVAGNLISPAMLAQLADKAQTRVDDATLPMRVVRFEGDPRAADSYYSAAPLWRRVEPDNDLPVAAQLADDIADWVHACEG